MDRLRALAERLREAWPVARAVASDAALRRAWLTTARRAQITLAAVVLAGFLVVPPVTDAIADAIFPPRSSWFGMRSRRGSGAEALSDALSVLYWLSGLGATSALLILHAPATSGTRRGRDDGALDETLPPPGAPRVSVDPLATTLTPDAGDSAPSSTPPARYTIVRELGRGGMGVVYEARDTVLDRAVALKELLRGRLDGAAEERFRREARVLAHLRHPGIVQVYDLAEEPGGMWMAMELVPGGGLDALLHRSGKLPVARVASLGAALAEALAYAHSQHIVHRDFKPANVLLGDGGAPKVSDFGLAKLLREGPKLTQLGSVLGSPGYMSPEQAAGGESDHRSDAYALGVTLFEMVTGRCPFEGDTVSVLAAHITKPPPSPAELGVPVVPELADLIARLLSKDPAARPSDLVELAVALRRIASAASS